MRGATFLTSVRADLVDVQLHIARESGSRSVARSFPAQLRRLCHKLAGLPGTIGRARPESRPDISSVAHNGHVIFFRYAGERSEVVNILERRRDIEVFFDEEVGRPPVACSIPQLAYAP